MENLFKMIIEFLKNLFSKKKTEEEKEKEEIESGIIVDDDIHELGCPSNKTVILIDNGHGKDTGGKKSPYLVYGVEPALELAEWKWNREIAGRIVNDLKTKGYDARLLVTEENDISLTERYKRANKVCNEVGKSNVLLISIHGNAAGNGKQWMTAKGWCAFTTKGTTESDRVAEYLYTEAEKNFKGRKIRTDKSDGDRDWEQNFTIIYKSLCPAVLTENFFYDNVDDIKYMLSEEGKDAIVKTHVDGIINYLNSKN